MQLKNETERLHCETFSFVNASGRRPLRVRRCVQKQLKITNTLTCIIVLYHFIVRIHSTWNFESLLQRVGSILSHHHDKTIHFSNLANKILSCRFGRMCTKLTELEGYLAIQHHMDSVSHFRMDAFLTFLLASSFMTYEAITHWNRLQIC